MNNLKCVIFDFDDTIVYSENIKKEEFYNISKNYNNIGVKFYNNNINKRLTRFEYFNNLSKEIIKNTLLNKDNDRILYYTMLKQFSKNVSERLKDSEEIKNIRKFLEFLKYKNYNLFISSKSNTEDIIDTLNYKNLLKFFDGIYGSEKSKILHFETIMKKYNFTNKDICFFGDSYSDYEVAAHFNCLFIGILTDRNDLKNIDCQKIDDYDKVIDLF